MLSAAIGGWTVGGIHHVGRTAVPGMGAKSVIDILVGVLDLTESAPFLDRLAAVNYLYAPTYRAAEMHWFSFLDDAGNTFERAVVDVDGGCEVHAR